MLGRGNPLCQGLGHLSGMHEQDIACGHVNTLALLCSHQVVGRDCVPGFEPLDAVERADVEQYSTTHDPLARMVHRKLPSPSERRVLPNVESVVVLAFPRIVGEAIQMGVGAVRGDPDMLGYRVPAARALA